ncbi:MAG: ATP-grasp domain-containing protein [Anaerolineae bacterium]
MKFVYLSPHFPPNYYLFLVHLRNMGVTVLGVADEPYEMLRPELKESLVEYYRVPDMQNYDELLRALGYFTHRYGKLDRLDSHNEYWLETEARLRTDFNIDGLKVADLPPVKRKSEMKKMFARAGVAATRGRLIRKPEDAREFVQEVGFPVIVKPDIGVGASRTYKLHNPAELEEFLARSLEDYIVEEFIAGEMETFDGLTDKDGRVVFYTSHKYSEGIMEVVLSDNDTYYYSQRDIPSDVEHAGRRIVKAYDLRERFFHFEFFRTPDNQLIALEVNMRPPGGLTTDMFNYANNIDIYHEWANVVVNNRFDEQFHWPYHCAYVGRKWSKNYAHTHDEIMARWHDYIVQHEPISGVFSRALGDYGYLVRSPNLDEILAMATFIQAKQ